MEDREIVELYLERDEKAISATAQKYESYLNTIAYNITASQEDSKESVNDTYLAAWNSIPPHRPSVLRTFLSKLTRRIAIDRVRASGRKKRQASQYELSLSELEGCVGTEDVSNTVDAQLLGQAVSAFLREQSPEKRNAFICRYYFLDSIQDTAKRLDMSTAKVKTLLYRTRNELREYLKKEGFDV